MKTIVMLLAVAAFMFATAVGAKDLFQYDEVQRNGNKMTFLKTVHTKVAEFNAPPAAVPTAIAEIAIREGKGEWSESKDSKTVYKNFSIPLVGTTTIEKTVYSYDGKKWLPPVAKEERKAGDDWIMTILVIILPCSAAFLAGFNRRLWPSDKTGRELPRQHWIYLIISISVFVFTIFMAVFKITVDSEVVVTIGVCCAMLIASVAALSALVMLPTIILCSMVAKFASEQNYEFIIKYLLFALIVFSFSYFINEMIGEVWDSRRKRKREKFEADDRMAEFRACHRTNKVTSCSF